MKSNKSNKMFMNKLSNASAKNKSFENYREITEFPDAVSVACDVMRPINISVS